MTEIYQTNKAYELATYLNNKYISRKKINEFKPTNKKGIKYMKYTSRIFHGKKTEKDFMNLCDELGIETKEASKEEDIIDKIDIWIFVPKCGWISTQIKKRDGNFSDIIFEYEKNGKMGRDARSKADVIVCIKNNGAVSIVSKKDILDIAQEHYANLIKQNITTLNGKKGKILKRNDYRDKCSKIIFILYANQENKEIVFPALNIKN